MELEEIKKNKDMVQAHEKEKFKAGFIAIVGRPSVGKSTFINKVCRENTAITSPYPQTTRNIIRGIVTTPAHQIVFLDTPGIHLSESKFGLHLTKQAKHALKDSEGILYMLDATRMPQQEEESIGKLLLEQNKPIFACINKMDVEKEKIVLAHLDFLRNTFGARLKNCHFISSLEGINIENLLNEIAEILPRQSPFYDSEYYTDQSPEFRICEQVRAAALDYVKEEIPHALYTELIESSVKHRNEEGMPTHLFVRVQLVVERASQQAILIGKDGAMIKKIRLNATKRIKPLFDYKVQLELRVSVRKKWRKSDDVISAM